MNLNDKQKTEYWTQRAEQRLINAENLTSDMLANLKATYEATIKSLEKEINAFYGKYATETGLDITEVRKRLNPKELKDFKTQLKKYYDEVKRLGGYSPDTKQYLRELSAKAYISRLEELQAQMRWQVENLYRTQQLKIFDTLKQGYEDTYLRATFDMQQGIGFAYSFNTLDDNKVRVAVTQKWQGSNFSDRIWADKARLIDTLNTAIPQGVALGQNPRKVAQTIVKSMNTRYSNAERLARTEMNHICNESARQAYNQVPDVLQEYKIVATLDNRTSEICQDNDNKVYKMSEWEEGITAPPFHPNCFSNDTEVYTKDGWKLFKDCTLDDEFLSVSIDQYMITQTYLKAKNLIKYKNNGTMYHLKNKDVDLCVTKDHNLYVNSFKNAIPQLIPTLLFIKFFNEYKSFNDMQYQLFFLSENFDKISLQDLQISEILYNDYVYCVELPKYHTLLVRRNGKICWCGNCRTTTVPYFPEMDNAEYTRIATNYETGQAYYVPSSMSYREWRASLNTDQEKAFIADKKIREQHNADVKQLAEYRKLQTYANKNGKSELFEGMPRSLNEYQTLKYTEPEKYEILKENARIIRGEMK